MVNNNSKIINSKIKEHFKKLEDNDKKFIPQKTKIPLAVPPYGSQEVIEALDSLLEIKTTMGDKVKKFEKEFSKYLGVKHALMVNSGSSANLLALSILSNPSLNKKIIKKDDEIITPAVTWATTVYPIVNIGAKPVFVDVKDNGYNIDPDIIESVITKKTKAILLVHLLGNPCNMNKIRKIAKKHNLFIIEDSCEAHGAEFFKKKVGTFGDLGTFSFFASHHITTMEGGMVVTNNTKLYEIGNALRSFGWSRDLKDKRKIERKFSKIDPRFLFVNLGFNIRPTELQGAFGIHQIKKLDNFVKIRILNAKYWNNKLEKYAEFLLLPRFEKNYKNSFLFYPITVIENKYFTKNQLVTYLEKNNIETRPVMGGNFVEQPVTSYFDYKIGSPLKNAKNIMKNSFVIGNHSGIDNERREFVSQKIIDFMDNKMKKSI
tara:strand:+ start:4109 stop:5404 length:1296 start_codon:yes stop_codon:yes gene_type:complete